MVAMLLKPPCLAIFPRTFPRRNFSVSPWTLNAVKLDVIEHKPSNSSASSAAQDSHDGTNSPTLFILHGLYGTKQNWRTLSKVMADFLKFPVIAVDLRNHGTSPHSPDMSWDLLTLDVVELIRNKIVNSNSPVYLMGHSMGGKVAMNTALTHPDLIDSLIVNDMAPVEFHLSKEFARYLHVMKSVQLKEPKTKKEAEALMEADVPDKAIRQFLLTNLPNHDPDNPQPLKFRLNLGAIESFLPTIADWHHGPDSNTLPYPKKTLFLYGTKSNYVRPQYYAEMNRLFPKNYLVGLNTGHWVHAEAPREYVGHVVRFLQGDRDNNI